MSTVARDVRADLDDVWAVLSDATTYGDWVVGTSRTEPLDAAFPAPHSRLRYQVLRRPLAVRGETEILELDRPRTVLMEAKAPPLGTIHIRISTTATTNGDTHVALEEHPRTGLVRWAHNPVLDLLVAARNKETLRRLARLAEQRRGQGGRQA